MGWRFVLGMIGLGSSGLGAYAIAIGVRGALDAEGTGEGWVALIIAVSGLACLAVGAPAVFLALRRRSPSKLVAVVVGVASLVPWLVIASDYWPLEWMPALRVEVRCFDPERGEIGVIDGGVLTLWPLLQHNRDLIYLLPADGGTLRSTADCTSEAAKARRRCISKNEEELERALARLPHCPHMVLLLDGAGAGRRGPLRTASEIYDPVSRSSTEISSDPVVVGDALVRTRNHDR